MYLYKRITSNLNFTITMIIVNYWSMLPMAQSSWLSFGKFRGLQQAIGPRMCNHLSLVPKQKAMCLDDPIVMDSVADGAFHGIQECQNQFRNEMWNCSTIVKGQTVFGKVINQGSKEASFVHAITTAGVMYAVTRACSRGDINSCSCDRRKRGGGSDDEGRFTWGGCSDDISNGTYFVREFVDASESDVHDARAQMNLHNNRAGTRSVRRFVKTQCRCHGKTGSCAIRTCWESLGDFRLTGDYLKDRYDQAIRVTVTQNGPKAIVASADSGSQPSKNDLVYLENSPNYCNRNTAIGIFGTAGRQCNATSSGNDGCDKLCCGRGYVTTKVKKIEEHMCEFHWCCEVRCKEREQIIDVHTCNGEDEFDIAGDTAHHSSTQISTTTHPTTARPRRRNRKNRDKKQKRNRKDRKKRKNKRRHKREVPYQTMKILNVKKVKHRLHTRGIRKTVFGASTANR